MFSFILACYKLMGFTLQLQTLRVAEGKPMEEVVQEMTLDEWKNLQQQNRPKHEFNIRRPESTVPSKAVVIHKSKYSNDVSITCGIL